MADKHPYITSPGPFLQVVEYLRRSFPQTMTADTLKKLGLAPKNESYIINSLRFIGVIDAEGKQTKDSQKAFTQHEEKAFQKEFSSLVNKAYSELFTLHSDRAWTLDENALITFFRQNDKSNAVVGKRQAITFKTLAALSGHGEIPEPKIKNTNLSAAKVQKGKNIKKPVVLSQKFAQENNFSSGEQSKFFGLTVRVEINLPSDGNQEAYDRIFKSIKENLLNG